jgi:hypothetical protein
VGIPAFPARAGRHREPPTGRILEHSDWGDWHLRLDYWGVAAAFKSRKGLKDARDDAKDRLYTSVLGLAEKQPVILFDTGRDQQRAWMVPQLCLIVDLYNFWATKNNISDIHYAQHSPEGAAASAARTVLGNIAYAKRPVVHKMLPSDPPDMCVAIRSSTYEVKWYDAVSRTQGAVKAPRERSSWAGAA